MSKFALWFVLFSILPASAQISYVRSNAQWSGGTSSCAVGLSTTSATDMFAVWGEWQTSGANTVTVTTATDSHFNALPSALGPTVQPSGNIAAQIFYLANIPGGSDTVTLTFSGTVTASACVIAEYTGADLVNPVDSVSAGYSYSATPGTALDSGAAAPANPNLVVFAAGIVDAAGTPTQGSGFTIEQHTITPVCAFIENNPSPTPEILQHANATCTNSGDWLMQMAVLRAPAWTVAGGWSPTRPPQVINAAQYPGADPCAQLVAAEAANGTADLVLPINGGGVNAQTPCSADPLSGFSSGGRVTITSVGNGNSVVLAVNSPVHISSSQTLQAPAGRSSESSGVMIAASPTFVGLAANRLWTNLAGTFAVTQEGGTAGCLRLTYYNSSTTPLSYQWAIRGTEPDVQLSGFSNPAMNGDFRVVAGDGVDWGDAFCVVGSNHHANGPTNFNTSPFTASFVIFDPAAANYTCSGMGSSTCNLFNGSTQVSTAQVQAMTYLICNGPCATDSVGGGTCGSVANDQYCAITLLGGTGNSTHISQGAILKNIGVLANGNRGVGGMFCAYCQEGSGWVNDSTVVARVPGPVAAKFSAADSGGIGSTGNTSQNMYTFQGFEDYCNDNMTGQHCFTASEGATYSFSGLSVNNSGTYSGIPVGLPVNAFAGYQFTTSGFTNSRNNQTCIVLSSTSTGTFTVTQQGSGSMPACSTSTTSEASSSGHVASGLLGLHVAFICNDNWDRTCIDNLTANYAQGNKSPAIWVNGVSDPTASNVSSGATGPELIGRVNEQSYQELILIGDQEPTKGVSVASVRGNVTPSFLYSVIISCNFNGGATCPATGVTTPTGPGNRTSDIGISNANGGPDATIWDQFENPLPGPLANCTNNTTPGCWTDAAILDWKMTNCISGDGSCTGPGISVITTSNQFPNVFAGGIASSVGPLLSSTVTAGHLACLTSTGTIGNCTTAGAANVVGVFNSGTTYEASGQASVTLDATVTTNVGDFVCVSTLSAGLSHENGVTACPANQRIGIVTVTNSSSSNSASVILKLG